MPVTENPFKAAALATALNQPAVQFAMYERCQEDGHRFVDRRSPIGGTYEVCRWCRTVRTTATRLFMTATLERT